MRDQDSESPPLDSADEHTPELDGVLQALAAAPRPRVSQHALVQLPPELADTFHHDADHEPARPPRVGELVEGRYRIDGVLGSGGMGVVFSASHLATGRRVALKWLQLGQRYRTQGEHEAALQRFVREARAAGRIQHPNVVDVHDAGTSPEAPFLVMELLEGETLRACIARGPLSWSDALALLLPAMEGVSEAHRRGVVHRDLKPDNVFLAKQADGALCPKVLDFGISRLHGVDASEQAPSLTRTGAVVGTPAYMPLEQLRAEGEIDARTDVYALGVVLYEMLSQKRPFVARNAADYAAMMASKGPTPLSRHRPDLRGASERVVMKALERNPGDRHESVAAFALALREAGKRGVGRRALYLVLAAAVLTGSLWALRSPAPTHPGATSLTQTARPVPPAVRAPTAFFASPAASHETSSVVVAAAPAMDASPPPLASTRQGPSLNDPARRPKSAPVNSLAPIPQAASTTSAPQPQGRPSARALAAPNTSPPARLELTDFTSGSPSASSIRAPAAPRPQPTLDLGRDQF
ncbi:MAG: protein kinase [Myxococcales bacterium]